MAVRRSSTELGLAFEKHSQSYLNNHLHMSLRRVGRAGDGGVDLRGSWYLPDNPAGPSRPARSPSSLAVPKQQKMELGGSGEAGWRRFSVVGQCKAEKKSLGPRAVRELEGVVAHLEGARRKRRSSSRDSLSSDPIINGDDADPGDDILAILLSQSGFSKNAMIHATRSHTPLMLVHLPGGRPEDTAPSLLSFPLDSDSDGDTSDSDEGISRRGGIGTAAEGLWLNPALSGPSGILEGKLEVKREILDSRVDEVTGEPRMMVRFGLFWAGRRLGRIGPEMDDEDL